MYPRQLNSALVQTEDQLVRIAGWILLIAGALLCATLVWATIGFLLMGVGLLSLVVAENNRKRASRADVDGAREDELVAAPPPIPEPVGRREPQMGTRVPAFSYDREAWRRLVEGDADLARVAAVLADYGQQYVDELAKEYLAASDKTRLSEIVEGIIGRAGKGVAPRGNRRLLDDVKPSNRVGGSNAAVRHPDPQPRPMPEEKLKLSENLPNSAPPPVEPAKQEAAGVAVQAPIAAEPSRDVVDRNKTITSADEELTAMLGKLAPDAATPKN